MLALASSPAMRRAPRRLGKVAEACTRGGGPALEDSMAHRGACVRLCPPSPFMHVYRACT